MAVQRLLGVDSMFCQMAPRHSLSVSLMTTCLFLSNTTRPSSSPALRKVRSVHPPLFEPARTVAEVAFMLCCCAASVKHSFARLVCGVHCPRVSATMTRFVFASSVLPSRLSCSLGCPFSFILILFRVHSHRLRPLPTQMRRVPTLQPIADLRSACCCGPINCHAR